MSNATQSPPKALLRFKLLAGGHIGVDPRTKKERVYRAGEIVESETDLAERFNSRIPGSPRKFERIFNDTAYGSEQAKKEDEFLSTLDSMNLKELLKVAEEEEIDLKGATKREDILKIIKASV